MSDAVASRRGRSNRLKGKRGEREVINELNPIVESVYLAHGLTPIVLQRNTLATDSGGDDVAGLSWLSLEIKRQETLTLGAWWAQCTAQASKRKAEPVLIYRSNKRAWSVRMYGYLCGIVTDDARAIAVVTVDLEAFKRWLHLRLHAELNKGKQ